MSTVEQLFGARHFTTGELADLGKRLPKEKLEEMELFEAVEQAEQDVVWRLKAAIDLMTPLTHILPAQLLTELANAEKQLQTPKRGHAKEEGGTSQPKGRTLPRPGTLLVKKHDYRWYNIEKVIEPDGTTSYRYSDSFRFLVVEQPCKLLRLNSPGGPIYTSLSAAAGHAAKGSFNGWRYFGIE